jgi:hypothetical protein
MILLAYAAEFAGIGFVGRGWSPVIFVIRDSTQNPAMSEMGAVRSVVE